MINSNIFYRNLKSLWESKGYDQKEFAEILGISDKKVSSWRKSIPKVDSLNLIISKFPEWNPKYLIGLSNQKFTIEKDRKPDLHKKIGEDISKTYIKLEDTEEYSTAEEEEEKIQFEYLDKDKEIERLNIELIKCKSEMKGMERTIKLLGLGDHLKKPKQTAKPLS